MTNAKTLGPESPFSGLAYDEPKTSDPDSEDH